MELGIQLPCKSSAWRAISNAAGGDEFRRQPIRLCRCRGRCPSARHPRPLRGPGWCGDLFRRRLRAFPCRRRPPGCEGWRQPRPGWRPAAKQGQGGPPSDPLVVRFSPGSRTVSRAYCKTLSRSFLYSGVSLYDGSFSSGRETAVRPGGSGGCRLDAAERNAGPAGGGAVRFPGRSSRRARRRTRDVGASVGSEKPLRCRYAGSR